VDVERAGRTGDPEVVYGAGKTVEQAVAIVRTLREAHPERAALVTRAAPELIAALLTMLNSCAPGVVVVNIDNGFGAGLFAARVARRTGR